MRRLVWLVVDGLRADVAREALGYLRALDEAGAARWATLDCALPSLSRPLYASLLTGQTPVEHGIVSNAQAGQACGPTVLHRLAARGVPVAAAAYHWFYELLAGEVFDPWRHRETAPSPLHAARWYFDDDCPDAMCLADAETLRRAHAPELLFVHPMGLDTAGHRHGGASDAYRLAARRLDALLALALPRWRAGGWDLLLTSDHGMHADGWHGGDTPAERQVPCVWVPALANDRDRILPTQQTDIAAWVEALWT
jgi:predicted AlkP superfamily pyrophosphatase or phosphodiesterase